MNGEWRKGIEAFFGGCLGCVGGWVLVCGGWGRNGSLGRDFWPMGSIFQLIAYHSPWAESDFSSDRKDLNFVDGFARTSDYALIMNE